MVIAFAFQSALYSLVVPSYLFGNENDLDHRLTDVGPGLTTCVTFFFFGLKIPKRSASQAESEYRTRNGYTYLQSKWTPTLMASFVPMVALPAFEQVSWLRMSRDELLTLTRLCEETVAEQEMRFGQSSLNLQTELEV
jgi:hypothetical protein